MYVYIYIVWIIYHVETGMHIQTISLVSEFKYVRSCARETKNYGCSPVPNVWSEPHVFVIEPPIKWSKTHGHKQTSQQEKTYSFMASIQK